MEYNVEGLNKLSKQFNEFVVKMGFDNNDVPLRMMLIISELSEAFEAFRKDKYANVKQFKKTAESIKDTYSDHPAKANQVWKGRFELFIKDSIEDELADSVIRLLDLCGKMDIDIEWHIQQKMKYNKTRGFKYGGKKF